MIDHSLRTVIGCMTGTSIDGLDAAAIRVEGHGLAMRVALMAARSWPLGELAAPLRALAEQRPMNAGEIARLALGFGALHARCAHELARELDRPVDLVAVHGQTVFHAPPASWQLVNAAPIAALVRVPVVFDLRQADLAAGGQGAPITPLADWIMLRAHEHDATGRAIVNLGGFCNVTILPSGSGPEGVSGMDVCPCNHLLDGVARRTLGLSFDQDGRAALAGRAHVLAIADLLDRLEAARSAGRSLGTGDEGSAWLDRWAGQVPGADLARSACAAIARTIVGALPRGTQAVLAGGGTHNAALVEELTSAAARAGSPAPVTSDALGVPAPFREAMAMAVLGALCQDRVPITLAQVTGAAAPAPISGAWLLP